MSEVHEVRDLNTLRHTAAHVMAQAVKRLFPDVKLAIGPSIEDGFYYDFDTPTPFSTQDLEAIEKEMKKIVKENLPLESFTLSREEAFAFVDKQGEPYKRELLEGLTEDATFYKQGDFVDLCAGPHMPRTRDAKAFKLLSTAGAYWRGDEKNAMLSRIYGTAFFTKDELAAHLERLEEAKKRDHNKVGRELEYFTTVDYIGQGLPILMPKGAKVMQILQRFVEDEECRRGYMLTKTPSMAKRDTYKVSGHWDKYRDTMFILGNEADADDESKEMLALRPMTCPFQFQVFLSKTRSYRDLPMRFNETATLFRNESSGSMHGLIRVRQFTLSEGHIACTPDQVEDEFKGCIDLAKFMLEKIGLLEDISYRFSKWDVANKDKYIGTESQWEHVQGFMKKILDNSGIDYEEADGEAAFYGPKLDIQIRNVHGKEDTLITIQIDFQLAERFGMVYTDTDSKKQYPYIIHRSSIGCYERTLALLIEKYAGAMPFWLAPVQIMVIPIAERHQDAAYEVLKQLNAAGLRAEVDPRNEKMGFKIREAQVQKIPVMLVLGDKEVEEGKVSVRSRANGDEGQQELSTLIPKWKAESSH
ncbi:MAG: threonine--tRNA ligase [Defluviitaleaceae bacterium]|nr:threonine--tRNA ligase [Defluviitaleaceae bacterium]